MSEKEKVYYNKIIYKTILCNHIHILVGKRNEVLITIHISTVERDHFKVANFISKVITFQALSYILLKC